MNFLGIGGFEILVIALVAFLVLGPKKMAEAGKTAAKVLSQLRKQRDELTAALLEEPGKEPPGAGAAPPSPGSARRTDAAGADFPGYPGGESLREPIKDSSVRPSSSDGPSASSSSDDQSAAPRD